MIPALLAANSRVSYLVPFQPQHQQQSHSFPHLVDQMDLVNMHWLDHAASISRYHAFRLAYNSASQELPEKNKNIFIIK